MPAAMRSRLGFAAALLSVIAGPVFAQLPVQTDCDRSTLARLSADEIGTDWLPRQPDTVYQHMRERIAADQWPFLADSLVRDFASAPDTMPDRYRTVFGAQLDTLRSELDFAQAQPDFSRRRGAAGLVRLERFRINRDPEEDAVTLF